MLEGNSCLGRVESFLRWVPAINPDSVVCSGGSDKVASHGHPGMGSQGLIWLYSNIIASARPVIQR
jgi:hypothetical protein